MDCRIKERKEGEGASGHNPAAVLANAGLPVGSTFPRRIWGFHVVSALALFQLVQIG